MDINELFILTGIISTLTSVGIAVLIIASSYFEKKRHEEQAERKEENERAERRQREKDKQQLINTALDFDFARDMTAGQETTRYKDMISMIKEKAVDYVKSSP